MHNVFFSLFNSYFFHISDGLCMFQSALITLSKDSSTLYPYWSLQLPSSYSPSTHPPLSFPHLGECVGVSWGEASTETGTVGQLVRTGVQTAFPSDWTVHLAVDQTLTGKASSPFAPPRLFFPSVCLLVYLSPCIHYSPVPILLPIQHWSFYVFTDTFILSPAAAFVFWLVGTDGTHTNRNTAMHDQTNSVEWRRLMGE